MNWLLQLHTTQPVAHAVGVLSLVCVALIRVMAFTKRRLVCGGVASVLLGGCCSPGGCNNDNFSNRGVITAGARFQLVVEEDPTPARLLLDSATGDLWQLHSESTGGAQWVRVASGPADARVLTPQEVLGMQSAKTPTP